MCFLTVTITEVMSTFTVSRDLSLLFKVTRRIYLWLYPHYPCLHLLFDLHSTLYISNSCVMCIPLLIIVYMILIAAKLWITLFIVWICLFCVHTKCIKSIENISKRLLEFLSFWFNLNEITDHKILNYPGCKIFWCSKAWPEKTFRITDKISSRIQQEIQLLLTQYFKTQDKCRDWLHLQA